MNTSIEPKNAPRLPSLDGWRAISILLVICGHLVSGYKIQHQDAEPDWAKFLPPERFAFDGVNAFFVISGFLISTLLIREKMQFSKVSMRRFYLKRAFRIIPVFYFYIITIIVLNIINNWQIRPAEFAQNFLFLNNFAIWGFSTVLFHTWSLSIEEQFYLSWPWIIKYAGNLSIVLWICVFVIVLSWVTRYCIYLKFGHVPFNNYTKLGFIANNILNNFVTYIDAIMIGCFIAILSAKNLFANIFQSKAITTLCLILSVYLYWQMDHFVVNKHYSAFTIPFGRTVLSLIFGYWMLYTIKVRSLLSKILCTPFFVKVGVLSYSLYIWQQLFLIPMVYNDKTLEKQADVHFFNIIPFNLFFVFAAAVLSYYFLERPILELRTNLLKNERGWPIRKTKG